MMRSDTPILQQYNYKPNRVKKFIKNYWFDWLMLLLMGGVAMYAFFSPPLSKRLFAVEFDKEPISYEYGYPVLKQIVPTWMSATIAGVSGIIVVGGAQIWLKSGKDFHRGLLCLVTCLVASSWFQVICKVMIGGFRPNFLAICKPDLSKAGSGYYGVYYDHTICTGDLNMVLDALESFPSGHSNAAFAGNVFIALYLNSKLKLWGGEYASVWKLFVVFTPILAATLLSLCRLVDYTHHWYDIVAGGVIGTTFAIICYRMHYRSILDPATNHLLLPRRKKNKNAYKEIHNINNEQIVGDSRV
jgi:membrane-associated phospholipid phosphatase